MDVVFDEVKGNVVGSAPALPDASGGTPAIKSADADRKMHQELMRVTARRARLSAD